MRNDLELLIVAMQMRIERLDSHMRRHEKLLEELLENTGVLNRKVELIHDETQAKGFLEEEDPAERARSAHQAVQ